MTIEFPCPTCRQQVRTPDAAAGKKGKCPSCGTVVTIPSPGQGQKIEVGGQRSEVRKQVADAPIEFPCPSCQQTVRTPAAAAGKKGKCPHCQTVVQIPAASPAAPATPPRPAAPAKPAAAAPIRQKPVAAKPLPKAQPLTPPKPKPAPPAKPAQQLAPLDDGNLPGLAPLGGDPFGGLTPLGNDPLAGLAPLGNDPLGGLAPLGNDPLDGLAPLPAAPQAGFALSHPLGPSVNPLNPYGQPVPQFSNPYQSPAGIGGSSGPYIDVHSARYRKLLKDFRSQMHALGAYWIVIGGLVLILIGFLATFLDTESNVPDAGFLIVFFFGGLALMWVVLGVFTCLKQIWAVYIGLVLTYVGLIGNLCSFNICGIVILIVVIMQAHRVIGWAAQLQQAGIPLNTRP